jgi:hypothetical protein
MSILEAFSSLFGQFDEFLVSRFQPFLRCPITSISRNTNAEITRRQEAHEEIRILSHQASDVVKKWGGKNDLVQRIKKTEFFKSVWGEVCFNPLKQIKRIDG